MTDAGERQRIYDRLVIELIPPDEMTKADRQARDAAELAIAGAPGGWWKTFYLLVPAYLGLIRSLCHGRDELMLKVLDASIWDAAMFDVGPGEVPPPCSPMTAREPAVDAQRRLLECLRAELTDWGDNKVRDARAALRNAPGGMRRAFLTLARMHVDLVVALSRNDLELARATLRSQPY